MGRAQIGGEGRIEGKAAHSGGNFTAGISAIEELAQKIIRIHALRDDAESARLFLHAGDLPPLGHRLRQPELAATLRLLADKGHDGFYRGPLAERLVEGVLAANPKQVEDYRAGKEKAFNALVGQVMKATKGKANPAQVNELLRRKLSG